MIEIPTYVLIPELNFSSQDKRDRDCNEGLHHSIVVDVPSRTQVSKTLCTTERNRFQNWPLCNDVISSGKAHTFMCACVFVCVFVCLYMCAVF
jgi:hypothetical protein